jgi:N6-L-threonylcarbamoyladenine synthase
MASASEKTITVLGIETSCDETAAAVVRRPAGGRVEILSDVVLSQVAEHAEYGGVVPEIAARAHLHHLPEMIRQAMSIPGLSWEELDAVAVTAGPGLIGGLLVGMMSAKAIALAHDLAFLAVNHLEAHALSPMLTEGISPPYLLLLISGGHTQLVSVEAIGRYRRYGTTIDDALGEAFDKVAKMLGLGYPGGPAVEKMAARGRAERFSLPRPMKGRRELHFSFSGLKTAVRTAALSLERITEQDKADLCAAFQAAVAETLADRVARACRRFREEHPALQSPALVIAGGVAANMALRRALADSAAGEGFSLHAPPLAMCTDNAAMVAHAGLLRLERGERDPLDTPARPRWPLDPQAEPAIFAGVKG